MTYIRVPSLARIMEARGVTCAALARGLHYSRPTVSAWRTGRRAVDVDLLDTLCNALHCTAAELTAPMPKPRRRDADYVAVCGLRRVMLDKGINGNQLSKRLGWHKSRISRYASGTRRASLADIAELAVALGVTVAELTQ